jgi:Fic family protein
MYNWQHKKWPQFEYNLSGVDRPLLDFMIKVGQINGALQALPPATSTDAVVNLLVAEAMKTSEIEGEMLSRKDVMSSVRNNLGLSNIKPVNNKNVTGLSEMLIDVRNTFGAPLTESQLFKWHKLLMRGNKKIKTGQWRTHKVPMQVVSGSVSNPIIHFEAPPSKSVSKEMQQFIKWFNDTDPHLSTSGVFVHPLVRASIAHLYFESIHPFEDGNGRIGRALVEKVLSQGTGGPIVASVSKLIDINRKEYYKQLQKAQQTLEITNWIEWFVSIILLSQDDADKIIQHTIKKVRFFDSYNELLNERQKKAVNKIFSEGPDGFKGGMNVSKYISITRTSKATATRDLQSLVEMKLFNLIGGGRSTRYELIY